MNSLKPAMMVAPQIHLKESKVIIEHLKIRQSAENREMESENIVQGRETRHPHSNGQDYND